jgi:hypothetical protein
VAETVPEKPFPFAFAFTAAAAAAAAAAEEPIPTGSTQGSLSRPLSCQAHGSSPVGLHRGLEGLPLPREAPRYHGGHESAPRRWWRRSSARINAFTAGRTAPCRVSLCSTQGSFEGERRIFGHPGAAGARWGNVTRLDVLPWILLPRRRRYESMAGRTRGGPGESGHGRSIAWRIPVPCFQRN